MSTKDLERRVTKLESAFTILLDMSYDASSKLLTDSDTEVARLIAQSREYGAAGTPALCRALRSITSDSKSPPALRLAAGNLLAAIELGHSVRPEA